MGPPDVTESGLELLHSCVTLPFLFIFFSACWSLQHCRSSVSHSTTEELFLLLYVDFSFFLSQLLNLQVDCGRCSICLIYLHEERKRREETAFSAVVMKMLISSDYK